jgi:hypothetical protein
LLTDEKGLPLSIVISGANTPDVKLLADTPEALLSSVLTQQPSSKTFAWMPVSRLVSKLRKNKTAKPGQYYLQISP